MRKLTYTERQELVNQDFSSNSFYKDNPTYFLEVIEFLKKSNYHAKGIQRLLMHSKHYIAEWIENLVPELKDPYYSMTTKLYWMLYDLKEYPKCVVCGKPIATKRNTKLFEKYPKTCSKECKYLDETLWDAVRSTKLEKYGKSDYMAFNTPEFRARVAELHDGNPYWNNMEKNRQTCLENYGYECVFQVPSIKQQIAETCLENYGVSCILALPEFHEYSKKKCQIEYGYDNYSQVPEIRSKQRSKYTYDSIKFDSAPELAFYIFLKDKHVNFEYQPNINFPYEYNGKTYRYFPDFKIGNQYVELKGDQFLDSSGKWICPYNTSLSPKYEAKRQCAIKNCVVILYSSAYNKFLQYIQKTYGNNFLKQFKNDNK